MFVRMRLHCGRKTLSTLLHNFPHSRSNATGRTSFEKFNTLETDPELQPSKAPIAAAFSNGLEQQISHLQEQGYVLLKGSRAARTEVAQLHKETLSFFESKKSTWKYRWWRFRNVVQRSQNWHALPLLTTELLLSVLGSTIGRHRPLFDHFLPPRSPLVELSSIISLPGSERQTLHSDMAYSPDQLLITGLVALSDVTFECGPTHLYPGTHTSAFHRTCALYRRPIRVQTYTGEELQLQQADQMSIFPETESEKDILSAEAARTAAPVYALLEAGDMLLFDAKIFHFGGANMSKNPRALLCFSFQRPDGDGKSCRITGVTYYMHQSLNGTFNLDCFPPTS